MYVTTLLGASPKLCGCADAIGEGVRADAKEDVVVAVEHLHVRYALSVMQVATQ